MPEESSVEQPKDPIEPVYCRLANTLRGLIADGTYPPGSKLPSALTISGQFRVSPMTARQAIVLLTEEGLLEPLQGSGTYVKHLGLRDSGFSLKNLDELITAENTRIRILEISITKADASLAQTMCLKPGQKVVHIIRILLSNGSPVLLQRGYILYDPCRPLVEAELDAVSLYGFLQGDKTGLIKKGTLEARPCVLSAKDALLLEQPAQTAAFLMGYVFYDFTDAPIGHGSFLIPQPFLTLRTNIGLWNIESKSIDREPGKR